MTRLQQLDPSMMDNRKFSKRFNVPVKENPDYNFVGLFLGMCFIVNLPVSDIRSLQDRAAATTSAWRQRPAPRLPCSARGLMDECDWMAGYGDRSYRILADQK